MTEITKQRVSLVSLGCPKNLVDAEVMLGHLPTDRYEIVTDEKQADIIIVNTCSFIKEAKDESIDTILEVADNKVNGNCRLLVVTGCLPQRYREELSEALPEVDLVLGIDDVPRIAELLAHPDETERGPIDIPHYLYDHDTPRVSSSPHYSAYVKIADGCSNRCSYCIIPYLRGSLRSRTIESIVAEVKRLAAEGVKEVNLIAQDITAFGADRGKRELVPLLKELVKIEELPWIRLLYAYPDGVTEELIDLIATEPKICKYLDLPLQHISDRVLREMNRRVTKAQIGELLEKIRTQIPGMVLRTSMIVGFPGESEAEFRELQSFVEEGHFDRLGVFRYSREEGTPAAEIEDQVAEKVKTARYNKLMKIQARISSKKNRTRVGQILPVLVEGYSEETELLLRGRSSGQAPDVDGTVYITSGQANIGDIVELRITDSSEYDLVGEMIEEGDA